MEADWLAEYGRTADLIVVGRGEAKWGPDYVLMEAALMDTGKPVLIAPRTAGARCPGEWGRRHRLEGHAGSRRRGAGGDAVPAGGRPGDRVHRAGKR